ncbi:MAG: condensation domain-containing protein, partial [Candidatus Angelobacter sp.]
MLSSQISAYRLSLQQKHLWMLQQDGSSYVSQIALRLRGTLKAELLRQGAAELVHRHQILRSRFIHLSGLKVPCQSVADDLDPGWQSHDWAGLSRSEQQLQLEQLMREESARQFDFESGPLLHFILAKLSDEEHLLLFTLSSMVADSVTLINLVEGL